MMTPYLPRQAGFRHGVVLVLTLLCGCYRTTGPDPRSTVTPGVDDGGPSVASTIPPLPAAGDGPLILASGFEQSVCGRYQHPGPGCEFGVQGDVRSVPCEARTGERCLRIQRRNLGEHMGVLGIAPLPGGTAFIGVAHRIPAIPEGAIPARPGYIELEQITPTDGTIPGWPVEVRLHRDRRIGLAGFEVPRTGSEPEVLVDGWRAPVDEWFYLVLAVRNGVDAEQRLWVFDADDALVGGASLILTTRREWGHASRVAQKVGGVTSTAAPMFTFADDWYISTTFRGPLRIGADGEPVG